uniref:Ribosomal protein S13 n=1 Tax=Pharyngomonas kirbyi TaxID=63601 RepID=A0A1W6R269_9EUKA|nr:ribosomal protein S13 [Pharyngomonas kirbyi]ARO47986.1 ribosomal protein S13 [Pharyngomonas kirbyi]
MLIVGGKKVFYSVNMYNSFHNVYGLNHKSIQYICHHIGLNMYTNFESFNYYGNFQITSTLYKFFLETERNLESLLKKKKTSNIQKLKKINSYRGLRHKLGFPARGQRTHSNANTIKLLKGKKKVGRRYGKKSK